MLNIDDPIKKISVTILEREKKKPLPKYIDLKHFMPIIDPIPGGTFVTYPRIVHEHSDLYEDEHTSRLGWGLGDGRGEEREESRES